MSHLDRTLTLDGQPETVAALIHRFARHMSDSIRDLVRGERRVPSNERLLQAAALLQTCSPSQIGMTAAWLDVLELLEANGFSPLERLELLIEVLRADFVPALMPESALVALAADLLDAEALRPIVAALDAAPAFNDPLYTVVCALPGMAAGGSPPAAINMANLFRAPPDVIRRALRALAPDHRERLLLRIMPSTSSNAARVKLETLSFLLDFIDTPVLAAALADLRRVSRSYPNIDTLHALLDAGGPRLDAEGLSPFARDSFDYWTQLQADARRAAGAGPMAEHAAGVRVAVPDAAELASAEAWTAATAERRETIAKAVLQAIGAKRFRLVGFETHGELAIAVFQHRSKKVKLCLLPGGACERGFSEREERELRTRAEAADLCDSYEEFGQLIDHLPALQPVRTVQVRPMLFGQGTGVELEPTKLAGWIERGPWRLPTEAEWEYAARGGKAGELTFRGDDLPLEDWFEETMEIGERAANGFGLWGFGLEPEICADAWRPSHADAPTDGSPATGKGPRSVRGGAAQLHPWQGCGEWQLLLTAMRTSQQGWDYVVFARPVIGLEV